MSDILPVITLYQPWATWIVRGWKDIESRTHNRFACLKGKTILIHSGLKTDEGAYHNNIYLQRSQLEYKPEEVINGFILCAAYIYDTGKLNDAHSRRALIECHTTERFGLFLNHIRKLPEPIAEKGEMGIWYYDLDAKKKVKKPTSQQTIFI